MASGLVTRNTGSCYEVETDDGQLLLCKVKGNFRLRGIRSTNPVAVGDRVRVSGADGGIAYITEVEDRRNYIIRRAVNQSKQSHILAANVDQALLVVTLRHPETSLVFVDRFLASAEAYGIPVILMFNKTDLLTGDELDEQAAIIAMYQSIGYTCLQASVLLRTGLDGLPRMLADRITLVAGNSGVGKSALINHLIPDADIATSPISEATDTGMHTTTFSNMYRLPQGGRIIDVPGVRGFGTFDFEPREISHYFKEIFQTGRDCRYSDCMHTGEPGCAVCAALDEGRLPLSRYRSYLSMLGDKEEGKYRQGY